MPVTITSVSPNVGFTGGRSVVEIRGTGFQTWMVPPFTGTPSAPAYPTVEVLFGGEPGSGVAVISSTRLFVIAPASPHPPIRPSYGEGFVDVAVRNVTAQGVLIAGESATLTNGYRYQRVQLNLASDYTRVTRRILQEMRKQIIANVSAGEHADYDEDPSDLLNVVDVAEVPALVLFGPSPQENRFFSVTGRIYGPLELHEANAQNAPDTDDLMYTFVGISDQKQEALSLMNLIRQFFRHNRWLRMDRDATRPELGWIEYDLVYDGVTGMQNLPPPDSKSSLRSFTGSFVVRGFNYEALPGFPLSDRVERTHQVLETDHTGPLVPEPPDPVVPVNQPSSAKTIVAFDFPDGIGVIGSDGTINVTVPFGTDVTRLVPTITHNGASISPASGVEQDFTGAVAYTVTAADGSTRGYQVTVMVGAAQGTSTMKIGTNFWYLTSPTNNWSGELAMAAGIDWATAYGAGVNGLGDVNIWNPTFLDQLAPYSCLRFMDWGNTNWSQITSWSDRRLPTADNYEAYIDGLSTPPDPGLAYEWMIDVCNRANKDMWVCIPAQADANYVQQLATLIYNKLKVSLRVYVEYSNETWNGAFSQFAYCNSQGVSQSMPGDNQYYQGQAYALWRSLQAFKAFDTVFGSSLMGQRVIRVFSMGGNTDTARQALENLYNSTTWNPDAQLVDMLSIAPYVGDGLDGASPTIAAEFHTAIGTVEADSVAFAVQVKTTFGIAKLGCYEGGQHLLLNSQMWSENPNIYDEYRYMLSQWAPHFSLFMHYTHTGRWTNAANNSSWGALDNTAQPIAQAHKYRAIVDWLIANP